MKNNYSINQVKRFSVYIESHLFQKWILLIPALVFISNSGYSQKNKDIIPNVYCVKDLGNGIYQASFGYDNPTKKEVTIDKNGSIIKSNNGKRVAKGLNKFKPGSHDKVFTKEFGAHDFVEWEIMSNGNTHTVIANANSADCTVDDGFIFPVIGNGKSFELGGNELFSFCQGIVGEEPSDLIFQIKNGKVLIEIIPKKNQMGAVISLLQGAPFNIPDSDFLLDVIDYNSLSAIDAYFGKEIVCELVNHSDIINFARPVYPAYNNSGGVTSQGDAAQTSNLVRERFRMTNSTGDLVYVDGKDVKIGILSDSFDKEFGGPYAALDVSSGELPEEVIVLKDNKNNATDEGRAMMQTIYDVAPGAELAFHTATASPRQFEVGFNALKSKGYDIIVDDITFITEPFFGTGRISQAIESFVNEPGKFHITSAGNLADKAFQSTFSASSNIPLTNFIPSGSPTRAHVFGTNADGSEDYLQKISVVPGTYLIALQYEEPAASQINSLGASVDLDIYLVDDLGRLLVGNNRVNILGDPTEIIVFHATGIGEANILITSANGPTDVPFRYIAFRTAAEDGSPDGLKFVEYFGTGAPTISGHAMTPASITVGAVDYRKADDPVAEVFSSHGGMLSDGITEPKVDIYAPDGGNTTTSIGQFANCDTCDKDEFRNFYGTSASGPHLAGAIALLMSAAPSWFPDGSGSTTYTADMAMDKFKTTAKGFVAPDGYSGRLINTLAAFKSIAAETPRITELRVQDGKTPSAEPFTVTIIGEFFPEDPGVLFDGQPLTDIVRISDSEITATVAPFTGGEGEGVVVIADGITPGGTDGGKSDSAYFFKEGKIALNIIPDNSLSKYGQDISLSYTVEGLPEDTDMNLTFPEILQLLELPPVLLSLGTETDQKLAEGGYPIVYDYRITPSFGEQDYNHDNFQINFISGYNDDVLGKIGYLTITRKDLTITSADATFTYGEAIEIPLLYTYDGTGISDNSPDTGFYSLLDATHQSDFKDGLPNKFQAVVSKFQAVVSGYDLLDLLDGGSWSASESTIQNKFQAVVSGMNIINLDNEHLINFIDANSAYNDGTTNKFQAVVSKFQAVVSAEDLFAGDVDLGIENKFQAVVSKFQAVVSTEDPERPYSGYNSVFSIIDADEPFNEDTDDPDDREISNIYSLNMITGLDATTGSESHYVYPGAFLNAMSANFNVTYAPARLTIEKATLTAVIDNLIINQGEIPTFTSLITGYTNGDSETDVFPEGIPYYFVDDDGIERSNNDIGVFSIRIRETKNYLTESIPDAKIFINPFNDNVRKVRTYADCVLYDKFATDGMNYTVIFRYENDNDHPVYVSETDNNLNGTRYNGILPDIFMPGTGTFEISFDGNQLVWSLTTYGSTHYTSVSSSNKAGSGNCKSKIETDYTIYPNPVSEWLTIEQNMPEVSEVNLYNMYGLTILEGLHFDGTEGGTIEVDMSLYPSGIYIISITSSNETKAFNIIKE